MTGPNHTLTEFPFSKLGYGRRVSVFGIGSAGCKIASELSKQSRLLERFVFVTCDHVDTANVTRGETILIDALGQEKSTPYNVRGLAHSRLAEIRQALKDSHLAFVISGLGGTVGSGIAPLIVREAHERGIITIAVVVMPYKFERTKHFFAGSALSAIRRFADGVILIDNDELAEQPVAEAFAILNERIALALNKLLGSSEEGEISVALNNVVNFVRTSSYSVLCMGNTTNISEYRDAVISAASHFDNIVDSREASRSIVYLCTHSSITMNELISSIGGLSGLLGDGTMSIEYGLSTSHSATTAVIVATGFSKTRFDTYDPIDRVLAKAGKNHNMDTDLDSTLNFFDGAFLQNLESE